MSEQYVADHETGRVDDEAEAAEAQESLKRQAKEERKAPCQCAQWTATIDGETYGTGCDGGLTQKDFIRGHDSSLKALFIRAGEAAWYTDVTVTRGDGGFATTMGWREAAGGFGFAYQVEEAVEKRHEKLTVKAARARAKAEAREAKAQKQTEREDEDTEWEYAEPERGDS